MVQDSGRLGCADRAGGPADPSPQAVSAVPALIADAGACNFCGTTNAVAPGRVLVHDNGSAICADCVAAAVLSLARYAQEAASAGVTRTGRDSEAGSVAEGHSTRSSEAGDAQC